MVALQKPRPSGLVHNLGIWITFSISAIPAQPIALAPRWQVTFPAAVGGKAAESIAVPVEESAMLVAIVASGADASRPRLLLGNQPVATKVLGHDPVSRLEFLLIDDASRHSPLPWLREAGKYANASLTAQTPTGPVSCRTTGWVKQVGGKVLPLALLRVSFDRPVPSPGTPLLTNEGSVVGILFQEAGAGNTAYAIPAEAVHRVQQDISKGGALVRGWLGLSLRADVQAPQVVRVLPDSPAAAAGMLPGDVLTSIGNRKITDYADAANAFFYLIPGTPVRVKLLRGSQPLEFTLTPTRAAGK